MHLCQICMFSVGCYFVGLSFLGFLCVRGLFSEWDVSSLSCPSFLLTSQPLFCLSLPPSPLCSLFIADASARNSQDRRPDHTIFPPLHGDVCGSLLPGSGGAVSLADSCACQVLSHIGCICASDRTAGKALWRQHQHCDEDQPSEQGEEGCWACLKWACQTTLALIKCSLLSPVGMALHHTGTRK